MWSFGCALISVNTPQSCSMLAAPTWYDRVLSKLFTWKEIILCAERWCKFSRWLFLPAYCSGMFCGLTGTQHRLFIGILELLCLSCCTIECIDFVTKLMKHAFSSHCQGRAPTVVVEALSSSAKKKKRMCKDISSAHTRFVVHLCISLYLSINCISMHVLSTVKTRWNVSFAYRLLIYSISTHYVRTQMNGTIRQWEDSSVHTVNIMWISCSVLYNDDLSFALEPVCRAYTLAPNHMTKTTLVSLLSEWHVGDEYIWIN